MSAAQADKPQSGVRENGMLGVNETRAGLGLALFAVASLIGLFGVTWLEVRHNTTDGVLETTVAIIHTMQSVVVVAAAWVYLTVEGSAMIAEKYLKKRYQDGMRENEAKWRAWYEANREQLNGVSPPPFMRDSEEDKP